MSFQATALVLSWAALLLLGLAMSGLVRQVRLLTETVFQGGNPYSYLVGKIARVEPLRPSAGSRALLFVSAECEVCTDRLKRLDSIAATQPDVDFAAVFSGPLNGFRTDLFDLVPEQKSLFDELKIPITPFGVLTDAQGVISFAAPIGSDEALDSLVAKARRAA